MSVVISTITETDHAARVTTLDHKWNEKTLGDNEDCLLGRTFSKKIKFLQQLSTINWHGLYRQTETDIRRRLDCNM